MKKPEEYARHRTPDPTWDVRLLPRAISPFSAELGHLKVVTTRAANHLDAQFDPTVQDLVRTRSYVVVEITVHGTPSRLEADIRGRAPRAADEEIDPGMRGPNGRRSTGLPRY